MASVAQLLGATFRAAKKGKDLIPCQGTYLGCRFGPKMRHNTRDNRSMFLFLSLSFSPKINKHILR